MTYHHNLRSRRLAELMAMGSERIRAELELIREVGWKSETIVQRKIRLHQREWGRDDMTVEEFEQIARHVKNDPRRQVFTYIHDAFPHHRGYCFVSPEGEVVHCRIDQKINASCFKPKDLDQYMSSRGHWVELDQEGNINEHSE